MYIEIVVLKGFLYLILMLGLFVGLIYKVCCFMFCFLFYYKWFWVNDSEMLLLILYFVMFLNVLGVGECLIIEYRKGMVYLVFLVVILFI